MAGKVELFQELTENWYFPGPLGAGGEGRLAVRLGDEGGPPGVRVPRPAHTQHRQMSGSGLWNMDFWVTVLTLANFINFRAQI